MKGRLKVLLDIPILIRRLLPVLRPGKGLVTVVFLSMILMGALDGVALGLIAPLIDLLLGQAGGSKVLSFLQRIFPGREAGGLVGPLCGIIVVAVLIRAGCAFLVVYFGSKLTVRVTVNLREALFRSLLRANPAVFEKNMAGEFPALFANQATWVSFGVENLIQVILRGTIVLAYLSIVVWYSWKLALALLPAVGFIGGFVALLQAPIKNRGHRAGQLALEQAGQLGQVFSGMRVVKYSGAETVVDERFRQLNDACGDADRSTRRFQGILPNTLEAVVLLLAMGIVVLAHRWLISTGELTVPGFMAVGFALFRALPLVNIVAMCYGLLTYAATMVGQLEPWLALPGYPARPFGTRPFEGISRDLSVENISYGYSADKLVLSDVSFRISAGSKVALVGASGSGKSTMAALLMRLREPASGAIRIDGADFWEFSPGSWHQRLGVVEQEPFLFNDTIRNNLTFGLENPSDEQIRNALRIANLEEVVAAQPQGLDSPVGERGAQLSGGQRQRLAIARAVARDPRLLILDEATSALDTISELEVQKALDEAMKGRTTLIIAHRLSTVRNSDWIVVMHEGRVMEQGTWASLMDHQGAFAKLVQLNELKG